MALLSIPHLSLHRLAALCVLALLLASAACGSGGNDATSDEPKAGAPTTTERPPATPTPNLNATPIPGLEEDLKPLREFVEKHGKPPQADLGRIRIPRVAVDAPIAELKAPANMDLSNLNPHGPSDTIWYNTQASPDFGGEPGKGGNGILSAHVDYNYPVQWAGGVRYQGPGAFAFVHMLQPEDAIEVTMKDKTARYGVVWVKQVPEGGNWAELLASEVPEGESITLITCTGDFNPVTAEYSSRTVVRARRYS